jgi:hypothetical protein
MTLQRLSEKTPELLVRGRTSSLSYTLASATSFQTRLAMLMITTPPPSQLPHHDKVPLDLALIIRLATLPSLLLPSRPTR